MKMVRLDTLDSSVDVYSVLIETSLFFDELIKTPCCSASQ